MPSAAFDHPRYYEKAEGFRRFPARSLKTLGAVMTRHSWSASEYREDYRHQDNFIQAQYLPLDFDGGLELAQAVNLFCDSAHIIGTTKHHQLEKNGIVCDRFRVVLKLPEPTTSLDAYRATISFLVDKFDSDASCTDGARVMYPCTEIVSICDGECERLREPKKKDVEALNARSERRLRLGVMTRDLRIFKTLELEPGKRHPVYLRAALDLANAGLTGAELLSFICFVNQQKKYPLPVAEIEGIVNYACQRVNGDSIPCLERQVKTKT